MIRRTRPPVGPMHVRLVGVTCALLLAMLSGCTSIHRYRAQRQVTYGDVLIETEDLEGALKAFQEAARLDPQMAIAHSRMGLIYRRLGDYDRAIASLADALRRDSSSFADTFDIAQLYHFTERIRDAIQAYLHAVELRPQDFDAQLNLGVCFQQAGDFGQAVERFRVAIDIQSDRPHAYVNLGVALDAQNKHYEAIRAYREALERDTHQPLVLVNLARTYMNQDRFKMARGALKRAIEMDPEFAAAHEALGYCSFRTRDFQAAERAYSQALTLEWRLPRAHAGLGSIHMIRYLKDKTNTDQRDQALEHWHQSLELNPGQTRVRKLIARYRPRREDAATALLTP